jgi:hypothetical protein
LSNVLLRLEREREGIFCCTTFDFLLKEALAVVVHVVGGVKICTVSVGSPFLFVPSTSRKENTQTFIVEFKTFEQF